MEPVFGFMKAILGFTRMSVRGLNKVKRELGFVLMALNIRKVVAQRAENNQKFIKRQFLYYFNRNCLFHLSLCPGLIMIYFFIADLPLILLALQLVPQPFFEDLVDSHISLIGV